MGPFLATRLPSCGAFWFIGAAVAASAVSLATLPEEPAPSPAIVTPPIWDHHGCRPKEVARPLVFVGPMVDGGTHRHVLQETTRATVATHRPSWHVVVTDQPATAVPGFYLEGSIDNLDTHRIPNHPTITVMCRITFWLATQGGKRFAVTTGEADILTTGDEHDVEMSREACVQTVVEDLVERKLIEAIEHPNLDDL